MLRRKMWRDIAKNKIQFASVFIMIFLGAFVYVGISSEWYGIEVIKQNYYEASGAADLWLHSARITDDLIDAVEETDGVIETEKRLTLEGSSEHHSGATIDVNFVTENKISQMIVREGKDIDVDGEGIWIDQRFAEAHALGVGDQMKIRVAGVDFDLEIGGLIMAPDYVYSGGMGSFFADPMTYGYAYVPYGMLTEIVQGSYSQVLVKTENGKAERVKESLKEAENVNHSVMVTREDHPSYATLEAEVTQHKAMGTIFPIAFLLIAVLAVVTTMTRLIAGQRTLIATLKALGFKKGKITLHYLSYSAVIATIGAIVGSIAGGKLLPLLFYPSMSEAYILPEWKSSISISFFILPLILVLVCVLITFFVAIKYLSENPAVGMRPPVKKTIGESRVIHSKIWQRLKFATRWNIRDISQNKIRSLMAVVGVLGCTGLMFCAFGMKDTIGEMIRWQYDEINLYNTEVRLEEGLEQTRIDAISKKIDGEEVMRAAVELRSDAGNKSGSLTVISQNSENIRFLNEDREVLGLPDDGIAISSKMAQILEVEMGDTVNWHLYGEEDWIETTIQDIFYSPTEQGIAMTPDVMEEEGNQSFRPNQLVTSQENVKEETGIVSIVTRENLLATMDKMMELSNLMVGILLFAAIVMALVVLYCLGIISFSEKYRELATLKVLGFRNNRLRKLLLVQNLILSIVAIPLGLLFGEGLMYAMIADMSDGFDMKTHISPLNLLLCIGGTLLVTTIVSLLFSKRVKTVNMVEALKGNE